MQHTARIFMGKKAKKFFFSVYSYTPRLVSGDVVLATAIPSLHRSIATGISGGARAHAVSTRRLMVPSIIAHKVTCTYRLPARMTRIQRSLVSCLAARRMASRTLLCKSRKGVAARVRDGSDFADEREKRREICPAGPLYAAVI